MPELTAEDHRQIIEGALATQRELNKAIRASIEAAEKFKREAPQREKAERYQSLLVALVIVWGHCATAAVFIMIAKM